jgi:hypothetical protein
MSGLQALQLRYASENGGEAPSTPAGLLPEHWAELQASAIAPDVAAANIASFGPGTARHWETERAELIRHARHRIATESTAGNGHPQAQAGHLSAALLGLDQRYKHLRDGGWRTLPASLPGLEPFSQWKPNRPREKSEKDTRTGEWKLKLDKQGRPIGLKYESPPAFPDGGGLLLPHVPERCWRLICERQGLPFPDAAARADGFWAWAQATPALQLLVCEGWKKALAAVSAGWAAVALPGVQMGRRVVSSGGARLIPALQALSSRHKPKRCSIGKAGRPWLIAFDAERRPATAAKVAAAAGALAAALRAAGGRVEVARLPLLEGADKTGLDDLLAAAGPDALANALANTGPRPVLPQLRAGDQTAPAGRWLADGAPFPAPEVAPLLVVQVSMGGGKTRAAAVALTPLQRQGVPILMPSHRQALGQAAATAVGVPWCPRPDSDARQEGVAGCLDSWCPDSGLRISGPSWSGGVLVLDEWMQQLEHLLLSTGTALGDFRRVAVLRTLAEQLARARQTIAMDAQLAGWGVALLEQLTGRRAWLIRSEHKPMQGRPLHCYEGGEPPVAAFRVRWAELVQQGRPFLCWSSAQQAGQRNAPQTLAKLHRQTRPADLVDVIDSSTPERAAEVAADPDGFAERRTAEAAAQGGSWALYCSPAVASGISFERWKPAAVIAYSGGRIAPEHAAQALARVRSPEVPAYLYAPERCPGSALQVGSGATDPAQLIADLRTAADRLLGVLEAAGADGAWLQAWAELGAYRNRQRFAYRATLVGLLEAEGWQLQAQGPEPDQQHAAQLHKDLGEVAAAALDAEDRALLEAKPITALQAAELARRRQLEPGERASLARFRLAERWGLRADDPIPPGKKGKPAELLVADRDGLADRLRLGWLLTTPAALALIPAHDRQRLAALDPDDGQPFAPDRPRVALAMKVAALQGLGVPQLLARFAAGEVIASTDPAVISLHTEATTHRRQLAAAARLSPGELPTGTLRAFLAACGWKLKQAGRIRTRGADRDTYTYTAQRMALPAGVDAQALAAAWLEALRRPAPPGGAKNAHTEKTCKGEKSPSHPPPLLNRWPLVPAVAIPWAAGPQVRPRGRPCGFGPPPADLLIA